MPHIESVCLCGASRISFENKPIFKFRCHCTDERRLTGNGFSNNYFLSTEGMVIKKDSFKHTAKLADNGYTITTHFCGECGSLIYRTTTGQPGMMVIKVGCIDDDGVINKDYVPDVEIFTRNRLTWLPEVKSAIQEEGDFTAKSLGQ